MNQVLSPTNLFYRKMRIDIYLSQNGYAKSRTDAKRLIQEGKVLINNQVVKKPSLEFEAEENKIEILKSESEFASRGGLKLEGALDSFNLDVEGLLALDVGASTGGFTDCLLSRGASHVIAVDSGRGQILERLRSDERVTVFEGYNARHMKREDLSYSPEIAVMDVSFISSTLIIPKVFDVISSGAHFICLIKPQFEVGKQNLSKGGIVKDAKIRQEAVQKVKSFAESVGFFTVGIVESSIKGGDGNIEYLAYFKKRD